MDKSLTPEQKNNLVEDALHTYPVAPMPRDITANIIRRIQTTPAPRPFRLAWSDLALGMVFSLCIGAVWYALGQLPPMVVAQLHKQTILFYQHILVNGRWLIPAIFFGLAAFFAALTLPYLRQQLKKSR